MLFAFWPPAGRWVAGLRLLAPLGTGPARAQAAPAAAPAATDCSLGLAGRVADHELGTGLPGATVRLLETGEVSATHRRGEYDKFRPRNNNVAQKNLPKLDYRNQTSTANLRWEPRLPGNFGGALGLSGTYQNNTYRPGSRFLIPYYPNTSLGAYAIGRWHPGPWLLEAGLRLDRRSKSASRAPTCWTPPTATT